MNGHQATLVELSEALQNFAASPRFGFLKTLQVGRFVGSAPTSLGILGECTFEKLVELGTNKIAKLRWLSKEQEALLITLLQALSEGDAGELFSPPPPIRPAVRPSSEQPKQEQQCEEVVSSVQVEIDLRERLQALKGSPEFDRLRHCALGQFWDVAWPRAPFEESFTLEQLIDLDMSILFRKRTMSSSRILYMTKAIDRALGNTESLTTGAETCKAHNAERPIPAEVLSHDVTEEEVLQWRAPPLNPEPLELAVLQHLLEACSRAHLSSKPLERALAMLPQHLTGDQVLSLLSTGPLDKHIGVATSEWRTHRDVQDAIRPLQLILQGPGISLTSLAEIFTGDRFEGANGLLGVQIVVRMLGAEQVSIGSSVCRGVWSLNPEALRALISHLRGVRKCSPKTALQAILPEIDPILRVWLEGILQPRREKMSQKKIGSHRKK
jgi:hypothetical protein